MNLKIQNERTVFHTGDRCRHSLIVMTQWRSSRMLSIIERQKDVFIIPLLNYYCNIFFFIQISLNLDFHRRLHRASYEFGQTLFK